MLNNRNKTAYMLGTCRVSRRPQWCCKRNQPQHGLRSCWKVRKTCRAWKICSL